MRDDMIDSLLFTYFGTRSPFWQLAADSNALQLAGIKGTPNLAAALDPEKAREIRAFTGVTSHADLEIQLFGEPVRLRSEEHTSELQSLMRISYAVFCLKKKKQNT